MKGPDRRLKELIARLKDRSAESCTRVSEVIRTDSISALPNEPTQQEPAKENSEMLSATVEHGEEQTGSAELEVARAPEEARVEPPSFEFEYIFVPDFMKGEALPEILESLPTHANYQAPIEFQYSVRDSGGPETGVCLECGREDCYFRAGLVSQKVS